MKPFALATLLLALTLPSIAQSSPHEPEFNEVFMRLDGDALVPLEREASTIHTQAGGFMVASAKASMEFPGAKSGVRFQSGQTMEFIVRSPLAATSMDPATIYSLRRLKSGKKTREAVFMNGKFTPFGGSSKTDMNAGELPLTFAHYGDSSLKATTAALPPGEYVISRRYGQEAYCFGID